MALILSRKDNRYLAKLVTGKGAPCAFCQREVDDEATYGKLYAIGDIQCHYFCCLLSCCLIQKGNDEEGLFGFMYPDIIAEIERSKKHKCSYCNRSGANLGCSVGACRKQFHLPCGRERKAISLYYGTYKSFCQRHAPRQKIPEHIMAKAKLRKKSDAIQIKNVKEPDKITTITAVNDMDQTEAMVCVICYEGVDGFPTIDTFWPPCCARDAWFHRTCLQRMALSAGMHYLKCPLCNDKENFYDAVVSQGYYVPDRDAAWELEQNAFAEIYERPVSCCAETCLCPKGREHDTEVGKWDIKLCLLCGSAGAHAHCINQSKTAENHGKSLDQSQTTSNEAETINQLQVASTDESQKASNGTDQSEMSSSVSLDQLRENGECNDQSNVIRYVCRSCLPAAPQDLSALASSIEAIIQLEQSESAANARRPIMPSRMSLRRTKGRQAMIDKPSSSRIHSMKTENVSSDSTTESSRLELNLRPPRRQHHIETTPAVDVQTKLLSPVKLLEQSFREKMICTGVRDAILDDSVIESLRRKFRKPRPLSEKKKIVNDILEGLFDTLLNDSQKQKEQAMISVWCSPKKNYGPLAELQNETNYSTEMQEDMELRDNLSTPTKKNENIATFTAVNTNTEQIDIKLIKNDSIYNEIESNIIKTDLKETVIKTLDLNPQYPENNTKTDLENLDLFKDANENEDSVKVLDKNNEPKDGTNTPKANNNDLTPKNDNTIKTEVTPTPNKKALNFSDLDMSGEDEKSLNSSRITRRYLSKIENYDNKIEKVILETPKRGSKKNKSSVDKIILNSKTKSLENKHPEVTETSPTSEINTKIDDTKHIESEIDATPKRSSSKNPRRKLKRSKNRRKITKVKNILKNKSNDKQLKFIETIEISDNEDKESKENKLKKSPDFKILRRLLTEEDFASKLLSELTRKSRIDDKQSNNTNDKLDSTDTKHQDLSGKPNTPVILHFNSKQDSSLEISENDQSINIDVIRNDTADSDAYKNLKDTEKNICPLKFSSTEKEILKKNDFDLENFKKEYLCEVDREFKCNFQHKHKENSGNVPKLRTAIDFALDAAANLQIHNNASNRKRKMSESDILQSTHVKKRKISESGLKLTYTVSQNGVPNKKSTDSNIETKRIADRRTKLKAKNRRKLKKKIKSKKNIEVTIDSSEKRNKKKKIKTKIAYRNEGIRVKIKWKKEQLSLNIESKKQAKKEKVRKSSKFKQYVLQFPQGSKEVLVKPEKEVSPMKRKYIKQEKTPDNMKQTSIHNFFKLK